MPNDNDLISEKVANLVRKIPFGRVTTYGAIAKQIGIGKSARLVGWILNSFKNRPDIPAHRVVNRIGILTGQGHFNPEWPMENRLASEGILVENNQVVDFQKYFWDPSEITIIE
jgi:methylated-DNA-protein-cysteine methyltransferase-like protein